MCLCSGIFSCQVKSLWEVVCHTMDFDMFTGGGGGGGSLNQIADL